MNIAASVRDQSEATYKQRSTNSMTNVVQNTFYKNNQAVDNRAEFSRLEQGIQSDVIVAQ
jgi:hypothetical protein